jgi:multiple sugar transport system substrate-binding protein
MAEGVPRTTFRQETYSMIRRRTFLSASAATLAAPALISRATAQSAFNWQQFKGQTISISLTKGPRADNLQAHQKEFEELTGIKVLSEQMPEQQQRPKMVMELASGNPSFDVTHFSLHVSKRVIGTGKWLVDMRDFLKNPKLTAPDYDFKDFGAGAVAAITQPDGRIDSVPIETDLWLVYYNKKLVPQMPKTLDEMYQLAKKLTDPSKNQFGFVARGLKNANVPVWTSFLLGENQETISKDMKLLTDTPSAIWAGEYYKKILRECAPPGVVGFNWNECQTSFMQGNVAMWLDGVGFCPPLVDPKVSKIYDSVGMGLMPKGPKAQHCAMFNDGIGIPAKSKNKEAAWLYCQWASGKKMALNLVNMGGGASPRLSTYADPALKPPTQEWLSTLLESLKIARPGLPEIVPVTEFRDVIGIALTNMIQGADVATELKKATVDFAPVLAKSLKA